MSDTSVHLDQVVTEGDVAAAYRLVLGRELENPAIAERFAGWRIDHLVRTLMTSAEFKRRQVGLLLDEYHRDHPAGEIDVSATPEQFEALLANARATWSKFGEQDPYWSVMTHDAFRGETIAAGAQDAFFATGRGDIANFQSTCARNGIAIDPTGTVLDFGCGVARLGVHLAAIYADYIGVDISQAHLTLAKRHLQQAGLNNHQLITAFEFLSDRPSYDCFFTLITLQHNPPPIIRALLKALLAGLNRCGIGYFQIPRALFDYSYSAEQHLAALDERTMEMHAFPQREVFRLVREAGCELIDCIPDGRAGGAGLSTTYLIRKP